MKIIILQTTIRALYLIEAAVGRKPIFEAPQCFELPEEMQNSKFYNDIPAFAKFVCNCIISSNFSETNRIIFCLEDDNVISKEYQHLPCKNKELLKLAGLEAETVLQDNINDYIIENYEYNRPNPITGKLKSSLFAVKNKLILELKKGFKKFGLYIIKIVPPISGLLYAGKNFLDLKNQTIAVLDFSYEKTRLVLLENGLPIFQRTFETVFDDIIEILMTERALSYSNAVHLVFSHGFLGNDSYTPETEAEKQISSLIDVSLGEAVRNIHMVLSSERLELDKLIVCGVLSTIPKFQDFCNSFELEIPFEPICSYANHLPEISTDAKIAGFQPSGFFSQFGLLSVKKYEDIDFLNTIKSKLDMYTVNLVVLAIVSILAICFMTILPNHYNSLLKQQKQDKSALKSSKYSEIIKLINDEEELNEQILFMENDKKLLTKYKSNTKKIVTQLLNQVVSKVKKVDNCKFNSKTGSISIAFKTANYNDYLTLKKNIETNGYFEIAVPFKAETSNDNTYSCSVVLNVKGFVPFNDEGGDE